MADCYIVRRGGGGGMSIKFIAVANESELPGSAGKNVVAVLYNGTLGEWQVSASEPSTKADGTSLANGDLWIVGGISDEGIAPSLVYVYSDSTWNTARFAMYQDGAWVWFDSVFSLYNYNKPMGYMAGEMRWNGFMMNPSDNGYGAWETAPTIDSDGVMTINYRAGNNPKILCGLYYFKNAVDLTGYSVLRFVGTTSDYNNQWKGYPKMVVLKDLASPHVTTASAGNGNETNLDLDVSDLTGGYYIGFHMMSQGATSPGTVVKMKEMYLE